MFDFHPIQNQQDIKEFHKVTDIVYKDDGGFIYPLIVDVEEVFDRAKNPAFADGDAMRFVVYQNGNLVGRAAAFYQTKPDGAKMGGMGFFECANNKETAYAIFDHCKQWLLAQNCTYMDGPVNFGDRDSFWGLMVECHSYPSYRENYQPPYYQSFFEGYGFEKIFEQSTSDITEEAFNFERFSKLAGRVINNPKYHFESLDFSKMDKFANDFVTIYNTAWAHHEDFKPLTLEKIKERLKQIKPILDPAYAIFAYANNEPIGFYISILEVNQIFKRFKGKLNLWNKLVFLLNKNKINKVKGIIFGVVPEYQNLGIETGMIMKFYYNISSPNSRISVAELAWIGDFNAKMLSMLKSLGAYTTKVHYTYRKYFS